MITILLQKILDLLKENLSNMIKFFVTDPQDGQTLVYDSEDEKWKNDYVEIELQETASGSIATFDTEATLPLVSLKANITAQQAIGTPTPDNPLPITGFSEVNVTRTGVNLGNFQNGYGIDASGNIVVQNTRVSTVTPIIINPSLSYYVKYENVSDTRVIYAVFKDNTLIRRIANVTAGTLLDTTNGNKLYVCLYDNTTVETNKPMVVSDNSITTYEPYNGQTASINLGQTVYGGEVDVVSGKEQITSGYIESYNGETINEPWISSMDVYTPGGTPTTGAQVVYPLTTPITLTGLTPDNFTTIVGQNNIFADSGDVEVIYNTSSAQKVWDVSNLNIDISSSVTVNTTDFSSVSYKIIRSGNVVMISLYSATVVNSYPEALFSGLPKGYNNANVIFIDTVSGDIVPGFLTATGYLNAANAQTDQKIGALITYITKDEV